MARLPTLLNIARVQGGVFAAFQAKAAGLSSQMLHHHVRSGRLLRLRRGVYRVTDFPASEQEDLIADWLSYQKEGVFSHQTALALHDLSDNLPSRVHLTLPVRWKRKRIGVRRGLVLHFAGMPADDVVWHGVVPVTSPRRTLEDCVQVLPPDVLRQAVQQALQRGLISSADLMSSEPLARFSAR